MRTPSYGALPPPSRAGSGGAHAGHDCGWSGPPERAAGEEGHTRVVECVRRGDELPDHDRPCRESEVARPRGSAVRSRYRGCQLPRYPDGMCPAGVRAIYSLAEVNRMLGMDSGSVRRFWEAAGLGDRGDLRDEEDVQALKAIRVLVEAGFPEEALVQLAHVYADALGRVAEAEARLFHFYVHERLKATGMSERELTQASDAARGQTAPLIEPLILYFHRKGLERAVREDAVMHLQEDVGLASPAELPGQLSAAILFVDLASFTPMTVAMGDQMAADVLERFSRIVREAVTRWEGRVVNHIGDAFMLTFPEPRSAVACALEIEQRTAEEPQFPAVRSGLHWGQVLYREGDYLGVTVNVAARVAAEAQRHQVLVTAPVRREAAGLSDVEFVPLGTRRLKGLTDEVELFQVEIGRAHV